MKKNRPDLFRSLISFSIAMILSTALNLSSTALNLSSTAVAFAQPLDRLLSEGERHFAARRYFQAIEAFEKALVSADEGAQPKVKKNLASAYGGLGTEYFNAGESRLAEETFRRGLEYADNYYSHFGLGYLYFLRMEDAAALKHLEAALDGRRQFGRTHKLLALLEYRQGFTKKSLGRLDEANRLDPSDLETAALLRRWRVELKFLKNSREVTTSHFLLRVDREISERSREKIVAELERAHDEIGDGLGVWPRQRVPVVLFTEANFHEATGSYHWVGGMYDGQLKMPVPKGDLKSEKALGEVRAATRHEYTHVLVHHLAPECPVWLNEGIAQHFEGPVDRGEITQRLRKGRERMIPFHKVPSRLWAVEDVELARWSYLQGLGFVEYLVLRYHEFRLRLLLAAIARDHSLATAFEGTYGKTLEALEKAWWQDVTGKPPDEG